MMSNFADILFFIFFKKIVSVNRFLGIQKKGQKISLNKNQNFPKLLLSIRLLKVFFFDNKKKTY